MAKESQGKLRTEREQPIEKVKDLVERTMNGEREQRKQEGKPNTKYPGELENEAKPTEGKPGELEKPNERNQGKPWESDRGETRGNQGKSTEGKPREL
jgi:hypothetical protein